MLDGYVNLEATGVNRVEAPTLERSQALMQLMGEPQQAYPVIHITGTNGKGSTARMITALLVSRGLSVGTYTSPDLQGVRERMTWNDEPISEAAFSELLEAVVQLEVLMESRPTRFELLTAAAYRWFADVAVDTAVVEVGLGGRWDATNVADSAVSVVTNVSLDHTEILGPTLADIAWEKAGIAEGSGTLVLGENDPSLAPLFQEAGAGEVWERGKHFACAGNRVAHGGRVVDITTPAASYSELYLPLHGAHQGENAAIAVAATEAFFGEALGAELVAEALAGVRLPGRMEVMSRGPLVILDGAHNPAGARAATNTLAEEFGVSGPSVLVTGILRGREPEEMLGALGAPDARLVVTCPPPSPRALPAEELARAAEALGVGAVATESVAEALEAARRHSVPEDVILVSGSLYVVGAAREVLTAPGA